MIIGTDGLWEFLDGHSIAKEINPDLLEKDLGVVCDRLLEKAKIQWAMHEDMIDDITFIAVLINEHVRESSIILQ